MYACLRALQLCSRARAGKADKPTFTLCLPGKGLQNHLIPSLVGHVASAQRCRLTEGWAGSGAHPRGRICLNNRSVLLERNRYCRYEGFPGTQILILIRSLQPGGKSLWGRNCHFLVIFGSFLVHVLQGVFLKPSLPAQLEVIGLTRNPCLSRWKISHQSCMSKLPLWSLVGFILA